MATTSAAKRSGSAGVGVAEAYGGGARIQLLVVGVRRIRCRTRERPLGLAVEAAPRAQGCRARRTSVRRPVQNAAAQTLSATFDETLELTVPSGTCLTSSAEHRTLDVNLTVFEPAADSGADGADDALAGAEASTDKVFGRSVLQIPLRGVAIGGRSEERRVWVDLTLGGEGGGGGGGSAAREASGEVCVQWAYAEAEGEAAASPAAATADAASSPPSAAAQNERSRPQSAGLSYGNGGGGGAPATEAPATLHIQLVKVRPPPQAPVQVSLLRLSYGCTTRVVSVPAASGEGGFCEVDKEVLLDRIYSTPPRDVVFTLLEAGSSSAAAAAAAAAAAVAASSSEDEADLEVSEEDLSEHPPPADDAAAANDAAAAATVSWNVAEAVQRAPTVLAFPNGAELVLVYRLVHQRSQQDGASGRPKSAYPGRASRHQPRPSTRHAEKADAATAAAAAGGGGVSSSAPPAQPQPSLGGGGEPLSIDGDGAAAIVQALQGMQQQLAAMAQRFDGRLAAVEGRVRRLEERTGLPPVAVASSAVAAAADEDAGASSRDHSPVSVAVRSDVSGVLVTEEQLRAKFDELDVRQRGWISCEALRRFYHTFDFGLDDGGKVDTMLMRFAKTDRVPYAEFARVALSLAAR